MSPRGGPQVRDRAHVDTAALAQWFLGTVLVAASVLVVVLVAGGGAPEAAPAGLPDAGPVTGWGLPFARLVADLAGIATVGLLLAAGLLLPSRGDRLGAGPARATRAAARSAAVWLAAVVVEAVLTASDLLGLPPGQVLDASIMRSFLGQTDLGRTLLVQAGLTLAVFGLARAALSTRAAVAALVVSLAAMAPPVLAGHAASAGSHELAVASLLAHVLAAALWVGGLGGLAWVTATGGGEGLRFAVPRFSGLALWCFVVVAVSGVVNALVRLGDLGALFTSAYGGLVLAKAGALGALGAFGWWHRRRTVRALAETTAAEENSPQRSAPSCQWQPQSLPSWQRRWRWPSG